MLIIPLELFHSLLGFGKWQMNNWVWCIIVASNTNKVGYGVEAPMSLTSKKFQGSQWLLPQETLYIIFLFKNILDTLSLFLKQKLLEIMISVTLDFWGINTEKFSMITEFHQCDNYKREVVIVWPNSKRNAWHDIQYQWLNVTMIWAMQWKNVENYWRLICLLRLVEKYCQIHLMK